jgi:type IV pilus assembly protein PilY1
MIKNNRPIHRMAKFMHRAGAAGLAALLGLTYAATAIPQTTLADLPVFGGANVPGNLALVISGEYPTLTSVSNLGDYADATTYLGYFDPAKCFNYIHNSTDVTLSYFQPAAFSSGTSGHQCTGMWSGNFMNWVSMQTIDPFRWALTGGYRTPRSDVVGQTILEKAWASEQGCNPANASSTCLPEFPYRGTSQATGNKLPTTPVNLIPLVTPFSNWTAFNTAIGWNGQEMVISAGSGYNLGAGDPSVCDLPTSLSAAVTSGTLNCTYSGSKAPNAVGNTVTYAVYVRVSVCETTLLGVAGLEANCVKYGTNYKPEGLLQQYANSIRYSVFSYLNGDGQTQQGGVLREPMGYIGLTSPVPFSTAITNPLAEWNSSTGVLITNPDTATASASGVTQSGVVTYLNNFGEDTAYVTNGGSLSKNTNTYMVNDNVSELYYAAIRYYENLLNVPEWAPPTASAARTVELENYPAVATWKDPIAYSCQKNFILGVGDDHTHFDYNVAQNLGASDPYITRSVPPSVQSDSFNQPASGMITLQLLDGISPTVFWNYPNSANSYATYFISGLAYEAHVMNIRPDLNTTLPVTVSTYWLDVEEYGYPEYQNPYYYAAKYGGFTVPPAGYTLGSPLGNSSDVGTSASWWDTSGNAPLFHVSGAYSSSGTLMNSPQPDNYFLAGGSTQMVASLKKAFGNMASTIAAYPTAFAFAGYSVPSSGVGVQSFASAYSSIGWSGTVSASTLTLNNGTAARTPQWSTDATLATQLAGTGWQASSNVSKSRRVATCCGSGSTPGIPFEYASLSAAQLLALLPSYSPGPPANTAEANYIAYLRGDQTNEVGSTVSGSTRSLRARTFLLGDIVDSDLTPVSSPNQPYSDATNPGYAAFKTLYASRQTMVYVGANDGMMHAFAGVSGIEQFAYVPSLLYQGPSSPATPQVNGLAELGNPSYVHYFYVDATPLAFDIDLNKTGGTTAVPSWHTVLIGGLGKGGMGFYAIDVTDPYNNMTTEAQVAANVKWEVNSGTTGFSAMGYSYGTPLVVKTARWGWVVALTSGYNNSDGYGHLYLVNPSTGALLQNIVTPSTSSGLTQASAFVADYTDGTADSIYVGDLNGQVWRFNLTATSGNYPAPTLLATLTDGSGNQQPVTTAPLIEISPTTRYRYVMVGTGKLLAPSDVNSPNMQTFYVILDGTAGGFNTVTTPIIRSSLTAVTDVTQGITLSSTSKGWYYDLGIASSIGWRLVVNPIAYDGIVSFSPLLTAGSACLPTGNSEVYAINYATAKSILQASLTSSSIVAYDAVAGSVTGSEFVLNNGTPQLIVGYSSPSGPGIMSPPTNPSLTSSMRLLNWREIPTAE